MIGKIEINENGRVQFLKVIEGEESPFIMKRTSSNHYLIEPYPIPWLTPTPEIQLLQENITQLLNQMDLCFKLILGVCIYFLWHFMAAHLLPSHYGMISSCFGIFLLRTAWKCFFANKNAILDEVKKFFEQHIKPEKDLH